jgi:hypothetical protein
VVDGNRVTSRKPDDRPAVVEHLGLRDAIHVGHSTGGGEATRYAARHGRGVIENWWRQGMTGGAKAHYDGIKAFSETDFTEDLKSIDVPNHGCEQAIRARSRGAHHAIDETVSEGRVGPTDV